MMSGRTTKSILNALRGRQPDGQAVCTRTSQSCDDFSSIDVHECGDSDCQFDAEQRESVHTVRFAQLQPNWAIQLDRPVLRLKLYDPYLQRDANAFTARSANFSAAAGDTVQYGGYRQSSISESFRDHGEPD